MPALSIRPATTSDLPAIGKLGALLVHEHHDFDPMRFIEGPPDTAQRYGDFVGTQMEKRDVIVLIAERDGAVLGYTFAGLEGADYMALRGPAGAIYDLVVDETTRRQGVGSALLQAVIAKLAEKGAPRVLLSTAQKNIGAQALFEREGFRRTMIEMTREL